MRVLLWLVGILAGLAAIYYGGGLLLLPDGATIERHIEIAKPPETIFPLINDLKAFNQWWMLTSWPVEQPGANHGFPAVSGPSSGVNQTEVWPSGKSPNGDVLVMGRLSITESTPNQRLAYSFEVLDMQGAFRFALTPQGTQTNVSWNIDIRFHGPFERWVGLFGANRLIGQLQEVSLAQLKELAETGKITPLVRPQGNAKPVTLH